MKLQRTGILLE